MSRRKYILQDATLMRFVKQTRNALKKSARFFAENQHNPSVLRRHFGSVQITLERFHEFQHLFANDEDDLLAANLIVSLGRWPAGWGAFYIWENELEFSIKTSTKLGHAKLAAEAACLLAELYSTRSADGDLSLANRWAALAVKKAHSSQNVLILGQAFFVWMQTLFASAKSKRIPILYQQAIQTIDNLSPDVNSRLVVLAFLCIPYARFLHRSGNTSRAICLITETLESLHPDLGLNLDIHKELYDLRGILYWASSNHQAALDDFDLEYALLTRKPDTENIDDTQNDINVLLSSVFANRALVFRSLGQLHEAAKMTSQAIELSRKVNAFSLLMRQVGDLGGNKLYQGELQQALVYVEEQLRMAQAAHDLEQAYLAKYNRAGIRVFAGQAQDALPDHIDLLTIFKQGKNDLMYAGLLIDASVCCWYLGKLDIAKNYYHEASDLIIRQKLEAFKPCILRCGALFEKKASAQANLESTLTLVRKLNRKYDEAACLLHLAYLSDDFDTKQTYWRDAVSLLSYMGALAWVENKSFDELVILPFFSA